MENILIGEPNIQLQNHQNKCEIGFLPYPEMEVTVKAFHSKMN